MVAPPAPRTTPRPHTPINTCFQSHHPVAHKWAVIRALMCRAECLSSSAVSRVEGAKHMVETLHKSGYPKGFICKQTCLHADIWPLSRTVRPVRLWPSSTLVVCKSQSGEFSAHFPSRYRSTPSRPWSRSWSIPRTQSQCPQERESSIASLVLSVPGHTLGRLGDHWTCACKSIVGSSRKVLVLPLLLQSTCFKQPVQGTSN